MRKFDQVKDIIEYSQEIHDRLAGFYDELSDKHQSSRIKMLLDYLRRHERNIAECLSQFENDTAQKMMDTWLEFAPTTNINEKIKYLPLHSDITLAQIVETALDVDNAIVALYRDLKDHVDLPELKELFENMIEMEDNEKKRLVRDAMSLDDM